jgi:20S proteasome subunit alpha 4
MSARLCHAQIREFLEKHYTPTSGADTIKLAIRSLMETVEASSKNIEIAVMEKVRGREGWQH